MAKRFCTVDDVKTYANVAMQYAGSDQEIIRFIEQVTAKIVSFTRRNWLYGKYVDFVDISNINWQIQPERRLQKIFTRERPLRSTPRPVITYEPLSAIHSNLVFEPSDFAVDEHSHSITLLLHNAPQMPRALKIEYYAGFETDPNDPDLFLASQDIREACAMQAAFMFSRAKNETIGFSRHQDKSGGKTFDILGSGFIREVHGLISPHVRSLTGF
jgi:hypothetical protein